MFNVIKNSCITPVLNFLKNVVFSGFSAQWIQEKMLDFLIDLCIYPQCKAKDDAIKIIYQ